MQPAQIFILDLIQLSEYPDRLQNEEFVSVYLTFRLLWIGDIHFWKLPKSHVTNKIESKITSNQKNYQRITEETYTEVYKT